MVDAMLLWSPHIQRVYPAWLRDLVVEIICEGRYMDLAACNIIEDQSGNNDRDNAQTPQFRRSLHGPEKEDVQIKASTLLKLAWFSKSVEIIEAEKTRPRIDRSQSENRSTLQVVDKVKTIDPVSPYCSLPGYKLHVELKETWRERLVFNLWTPTWVPRS